MRIKGIEMNSITIIEKINPNKKNSKRNMVFFTIGGMMENETISKLISILKQCEEIDGSRTLYKRDGVEVMVKDQDIPRLVKKITEEDIDIYSIYKKENLQDG